MNVRQKKILRWKAYDERKIKHKAITKLLVKSEYYPVHSRQSEPVSWKEGKLSELICLKVLVGGGNENGLT